MNRLVFTVMLFLSVQFVTAQVDSSFTKSDNQPVDSCEMITNYCQNQICRYSPEDVDAIWQFIVQWEDFCGLSEPMQRLKILLGISENAFLDSIYYDYLKYELGTFRDRVYASKQEDYLQIYKENKAYFGFVELKGQFDSWTKQLALKLKETQDKKSSSYLFCVLFSEDVDTFDSLAYSREYKDSYVNNSLEDIDYALRDNSMTFSIYTGGWMPFGKLRRKYELSPLIGVTFVGKITPTWILEMGGHITILRNSKEIQIDVDDSIFDTKSKIGGTFGIWMSKEFNFNSDYYLYATSGLAYSFLNTDIEKPRSEDEETSYYTIGALDISLGYGIYKKIFKYKCLGLTFVYHFAPYNMDKKLVTDLSPHSLTMNLFFRF